VNRRSLVVVHVERAEDEYQLISARLATRRERTLYEENSKSVRVAKPARARKRSAPEMRPEYDFSAGVRGKYAKAFARGSNVVVLKPDLIAEFPSASAVNRALRAYLKGKSAHRTA